MNTDLFSDATIVATSEADISDEMLAGIIREGIDATADFEEPISPPIAGEYLAKVYLSDKGITAKVPASKKTYLLANAYFRLLDKKGNETDFSVFPEFGQRIDSIKSPFSETTRLDDLLNKVGQPSDGTWNLLQLKQHALTVFAGNPIIRLIIEWKAIRKATEKELKDNPKNTYITIVDKMTDFPKLEDGSYQNWIENNGVKLYARAYPVHYLKV